MKPIIVYVSSPNEKDAETLGAKPIKQKLASCVMTIPGIHSQYLWKGKFQHDKEVLMMIKTFDSKYKELEKTVKMIHRYETPAIIAVPITAVNKDYLNWSKKVIQ